MNKSIIAIFCIFATGAVALSGCQDRGANERRIRRTMDDWKAALAAKDLDGVMKAYSENYVSQQGGGKEDVRQFIKNVFDRGYMDNARTVLDDAETTISGDIARFGPVKFVSDTGGFEVGYVLTKEKKTWRITGSRSSGGN